MSAIFSPEMIILFCWFLVTIAVALMILRKIKPKNVFKTTTPSIVRTAVLIVASTTLATILSSAFKQIFQIPRPVEMLVQEIGFSFPSGHATMTVAFFSAGIVSLFLFYRNLPAPIIKLKVWVSILIMVGVCASRLVLHVHRLEDVVVGALLGLISTIFAQSFFRKEIFVVDKGKTQ
ncbi:MAG: hypothetical protein RJB39_463 [Candidatus Parcubacteria bacterium]|jgi:membrane-associated phospholipid phosphatase